MSFWYMRDIHPEVCEGMATLFACASKLRCDDVNYKRLTVSTRVCLKCDFYALGNVHNIVTHCPKYEGLRSLMYDHI